MRSICKHSTLPRFAIMPAVLLACLIIFMSAVVITENEFLQRLGLTEKQADQNISQGFLSGYINTRALARAKEIPASDHPLIVTAAVKYAKRLTASLAFNEDYQKMRLLHQPGIKDLPITPDSLRQININNARKTLQAAEEGLKNTSGDLKQVMEEMVKTAKQALEEAQHPNNPYLQMYKENYPQLLQQAKDGHAAMLKEWNEKYPEDVKDFIKKRLTEFLEETRDINFAAATAMRNGKKRFVQPEYESKGNNWKLGYRMGSNAINAARKSVREWLDDLSKK